MTILQSIILGIVQGLTEFLPISSSAHLVLVPHLLGWTFPQDQAFVFDVLVQLGTLLAVIVYFWKDLIAILAAFFKGIFSGKPFGDPLAREGWYLILATIPAGIIGVLLKDRVEAAFGSPQITAVLLLVTAVLLIVAEWVGKRNRTLDQLTWKDALWIGFAQAISIFPGVSRSGSTIAGAMTRNLERPAAARFSFLMSIPIMLAAGLLAGKDMLGIPALSSFLPVMIVGFLTAAVVGYLSIRWLLHYLNRRPLTGFAIYCVVVSIVSLVWMYVA